MSIESRHSNRFWSAARWMCALFAAALGAAALAAEVTPQTYTERQLQTAERELFDALDQPWYRLELVIFERLGVLAFSNQEQLIVDQTRTVPSGLMPLLEVNAELANLLEENDRTWVSAPDYCIGVPEFGDHLEANPLNASAIDPSLDSSRDPVLEASLDPAQLDTSLPATTNETPVTLTEAERAIKNFSNQLKAFEQSLINESLLPSQNLSLETPVKLLNRRRHLRPLIHTGWLQAVPDRSSELPVQVDFREADLPTKLLGYVGLTVGRYLHLSVDLWYATPALGWQPQPVVAATRVPILPRTLDPSQLRHMRMQESRRMKSGELHYLDHPKLGVIARVDPVKIPPALITRYLELGKPNLNLSLNGGL